jgi:hypothetical protein
MPSLLTLVSFSVRRLPANYGLQDLDQKYWDTWNSLRMGPSQSITEYNVDFQQALTDQAGHVTDEQIKIEKYCALYNPICASCAELLQQGPVGQSVIDPVNYATLQWPAVQEHIARSKKASQEPTKVGRKRKASGSGAKGSGRSSKPKLKPVPSCLMSNTRNTWLRSFATSAISLTTWPGTALRTRRVRRAKAARLQLLVVLAQRTICPKGIFRVSRCRRASA